MMPRPKLSSKVLYMTSPEVASKLHISIHTLRYWIKQGVLPEPSLLDEGVRLFNQEWLDKAIKIKIKLKGG
jgi:DNA-binding transcriptional MerR regulator